MAKKKGKGLKSACWKGYEAIGMKTKNGRKVPNCCLLYTSPSPRDRG